VCTSASQTDLRASDRFEFLRLSVEPPGVLAQVVGCGVELVLVVGKRRTAQIGPWAAPGVDIAVAVEAHDRRGLDRFGEVSEVSGPSAEIVGSVDCVHHLAVGALRR